MQPEWQRFTARTTWVNAALSSSVIIGYESEIVDKITEYCSHENRVKLEVTYFESDTHHNRS